MFSYIIEMIKNTVDILKSLAETNRLQIVLFLREADELCACQVIELLGLTGATISKHLSLLQNAGIIGSRKEGRWVYYKLSQSLELVTLIDWIASRTQDDETKVLTNEYKHILSQTPEELCIKQRKANCC